MAKRPVSPKVFSIIQMLRGYPDARNHQIASYLGVHPQMVGRIREEYGLQRKAHPPLVGKRPVPKPFVNRWKGERI